jgi:hypothetical protein
MCNGDNFIVVLICISLVAKELNIFLGTCLHSYMLFSEESVRLFHPLFKIWVVGFIIDFW